MIWPNDGTFLWDNANVVSSPPVETVSWSLMFSFKVSATVVKFQVWSYSDLLLRIPIWTFQYHLGSSRQTNSSKNPPALRGCGQMTELIHWKKKTIWVESKVKRGKKSAPFQDPRCFCGAKTISSEGRWESCLSLDWYACAEGEWELALLARHWAGSGTHIYRSSWWAVWRNVRHCALCLYSLTNDLLFASILCLCCSSTILLFNVIFFPAGLTQLLKSLIIIFLHRNMV